MARSTVSGTWARSFLSFLYQIYIINTSKKSNEWWRCHDVWYYVGQQTIYFEEAGFLFVEERYYPLLPAKARRRRAILTNDFSDEVGIRLQFYHTAETFEISSLCLATTLIHDAWLPTDILENRKHWKARTKRLLAMEDRKSTCWAKFSIFKFK